MHMKHKRKNMGHALLAHTAHGYKKPMIIVEHTTIMYIVVIRTSHNNLYQSPIVSV